MNERGLYRYSHGHKFNVHNHSSQKLYMKNYYLILVGNLLEILELPGVNCAC